MKKEFEIIGNDKIKQVITKDGKCLCEFDIIDGKVVWVIYWNERGGAVTKNFGGFIPKFGRK